MVVTGRLGGVVVVAGDGRGEGGGGGEERPPPSSSRSNTCDTTGLDVVEAGVVCCLLVVWSFLSANASSSS